MQSLADIAAGKPPPPSTVDPSAVNYSAGGAPANQSDFLGGGGDTLSKPAAQAPTGVDIGQEQRDSNVFAQLYGNGGKDAANIAGAPYARGQRQDPGYDPNAALAAYLNGNIGGATGAYNASRAAIGTPNEMNLAQATPQNAFTKAAQAGVPIPLQTGGANGLNPSQMQDYSSLFAGAGNQQAANTNLANSVLAGATAPGGAGGQQQQDALAAAMNYANGTTPKAASGVLSQANAFAPAAQQGALSGIQGFLGQGAAPSAAQSQLNSARQQSMGDALSLARSGRARDAGSQARALNVAQGENAATEAQAGNASATLRAQEAQQAQQNQLSALGLQSQTASGIDQNTLSALGLSGQLASGLDQSTLSALGLQGDLANQLRSAGDTERGQTLGFAQGQNATAATQTGDLLKNIPQFETVRHADEYGLTPEQQLAQTQMQGQAQVKAAQGKQPTAVDYLLKGAAAVTPLL